MGDCCWKIAQSEELQVLSLAEKLGWPIFADLTSGIRLGCTHTNMIHYLNQIRLSQHLASMGFAFRRTYHNPNVIMILSEQITEPLHDGVNHSLRNDPTLKLVYV